jgi:hypothetical protein
MQARVEQEDLQGAARRRIAVHGSMDILTYELKPVHFIASR